jgi:transcription antitermination factor NusG
MSVENADLISRFPEERPLEADEGAWWVIHTKPNCEKILANYLKRRGISYCLPLYKRKKRVGGLKRIREIAAPLFRGYVCIALDKQDHHLLYDNKKMVRIIPVLEQERFISQLNSVLTATEAELEMLVKPGLAPGRRVRILSGPLAGVEGVLKVRKADRKLAISVEMFNQSVLVSLDPYTDMEAL